MINYFIQISNTKLLSFIGIMFAFTVTCILLYSFSALLPKDIGRDFAHDGKLSAGKPRGAGFLFIIAFIVTTILFIKPQREIIIYLIYVAAAMLTGFMDDCSKDPWGELKKGIADFVVALMVAVSFLNFNPNIIHIVLLGKSFTIHPVLFAVGVIILVWTSINVTNCSDGVDGLSGFLSIITLITIFIVYYLRDIHSEFGHVILLFTMCILGYLWYNVTPSSLIMGDAGSRAMGLFISIMILKTGRPFLYIPVAFVLIVDGGLGLLKVTLLRFFKIRVLTKVRTPLHDHVRKVWGWSNTQVVFRFAIIQTLLSIGVIYMIYSR